MRKKLFGIISALAICLVITISILIIPMGSEDPEGAFANPVNITMTC